MNTNLAIAAAVSGLMLAGTMAMSSEAHAAKNGHCHGVNSCKGKGACGGKDHACAGKNECKGKGWLDIGKKECNKKVMEAAKANGMYFKK